MKKSSKGGQSGESSPPPEKSRKTKTPKNARSLWDVLGFTKKEKKADAEEPEPPKRTQFGRQGLQLKTSYSARSGNDAMGGPAKRNDRRPDKRAEKPAEKRIEKRADKRDDKRGGQRPGDRPNQRPDQRDDSRSQKKFGRKRDEKPKQGRLAGPEPRGNERPRPRQSPPEVAARDPGGAVMSKGRGMGSPRLEGMIKRHPDGFGFLIPDDKSHADVYISRQYMTGVMTNDRVEAEVYRARDDDARYYGEITKVLKRANSVVVGRYLPVDRRYGVIQDDGKGWGMDLRIAAEDSMDAKDGDLVAAEIKQYPMRDREFVGRVVNVIGDVDDPLNDVKRVIFSAHIPHDFSPKAAEEARAYGGRVREEDVRGREDMRRRMLITIDGATARDFDDAVLVEAEPGGFRLWVAIADVSHYVKPGTQLDQDAYERGTSTYFPNYVVPMLPEELSNELCSLNPKVPRLCFVCEMKLGFQGEIQSYKFYEAVMESKARVTYGEAQEVIDGHTPDRLQHVADNIRRAGDLAKILMAKRFREGSLDLEIPETQVVVDSSGETVDVIRAERLFAHRLIEELMLVTNICCARFMEENNIPGIYRIHEEPDPENIETLQRFLWNFGGTGAMAGGKLQKKIGKALESFQGRPEAQILNILTLRAMNQAKYSPANVGHFGLGFSQYAHFTSPIRRYPDLIAHRLIKSVLYDDRRGLRMSEDDLATAATMLSACEQRSTKAERQLISIKKARFMQRFVGEEFDGMVSSVARFGCFVLLRAYDVDGLVKIEDLGDDRFVFDEDNLRLVGKRTGLQWSIGDSIRVAVRSVDPEAGRIDLELAAEQPERAAYADELPADDADERGGRRAKERTGGSRERQASSDGDRKRDQKRRSPEDNRGDVRKARVSKRRRKN